MATTPGTAPFLSKMSIGGIARLNQASEYELGGFPIQQLYMLGGGGTPSLKSSQKFIIDFERALREIGVLRSRLGTADVKPRRQHGQAVVSTLFQYYKDLISNDIVARLRQPGMPQGGVLTTEAALRAEAEQMAVGIIEDLTQRVLRTWELQSCQMMSQSTAALTVDGAAVSFATRVLAPTVGNGQVSSAPWSTVGTDIVADIGKFQRVHVEKAGFEPTHIITSYRLRDDLAKNDSLRAFIDNNSAFRQAVTSLPLQQMDAGMQATTHIEHKGYYYTESVADSGDYDTQNFFWDVDFMVFVSLQRPRNVLDMATTPTALDQYRGGLFVNRWQLPETLDEWVGVGANAVPYNLDASKITLFDLTGP